MPASPAVVSGWWGGPGRRRRSRWPGRLRSTASTSAFWPESSALPHSTRAAVAQHQLDLVDAGDLDGVDPAGDRRRAASRSPGPPRPGPRRRVPGGGAHQRQSAWAAWRSCRTARPRTSSACSPSPRSTTAIGVRSVTAMCTPCGQLRETSARRTAAIDSTRAADRVEVDAGERGARSGTSAARSICAVAAAVVVPRDLDVAHGDVAGEEHQPRPTPATSGHAAARRARSSAQPAPAAGEAPRGGSPCGRSGRSPRRGRSRAAARTRAGEEPPRLLRATGASPPALTHRHRAPPAPRAARAPRARAGSRRRRRG